MKTEKNKLLLHCCCAPCAAYVIEVLEAQYDLTLFFYNPNIHPEYEYKKRLNELEDFSKIKNLKLIVDDYALGEWLKKTDGHSNDPERGERCKICYFSRLEKTAIYAKNHKFAFWGTTLSISPHKNAEAINLFGNKLGKEHKTNFFETDFKKNDGFKKSLELSRQYNFYRQDYCGCLYSQVQKISLKEVNYEVK